MTSAQTLLLAFIPAAYLIGSVPFGLIVGLSKGVDPRKQGSGNIGATNVGRLLGRKFFALVFTLDMLKGLLPTLAAGALLHFDTAGPHALWSDNRLTRFSYVLWLLVAFGTIAGHMFSIFLRFKGGKGVATSAGVILGVFPYYTLAAIPALLVFLLAIKLTRYVSVASIVGTTAFLLGYMVLGLIFNWGIFARQLPLLAFAVLVVAMIIFKHRGNLAHLRNGTEHRIGAKQAAT